MRQLWVPVVGSVALGLFAGACDDDSGSKSKGFDAGTADGSTEGGATGGSSGSGGSSGASGSSGSGGSSGSSGASGADAGPDASAGAGGGDAGVDAPVEAGLCPPGQRFDYALSTCAPCDYYEAGTNDFGCWTLADSFGGVLAFDPATGRITFDLSQWGEPRSGTYRVQVATLDSDGGYTYACHSGAVEIVGPTASFDIPGAAGATYLLLDELVVTDACGNVRAVDPAMYSEKLQLDLYPDQDGGVSFNAWCSEGHLGPACS